jgi:hypothetical protein
VVPYYEPIWTDTPVEPRLAHFRAVTNSRQKRLVQHRQLHEGEVIREQTGMRLVGYVYRDANGVIARNIFYLTPYSYYPSRSFGALGPEFDPSTHRSNCTNWKRLIGNSVPITGRW